MLINAKSLFALTLCCTLAACGGESGGNTTVLDTDGDGIPEAQDNCPNIANPDQSDDDNDGIGYECDTDWDNDDLTNDQELELGTNPEDPDTDNDGIPDGVEFINDSSNNTALDSDNDSIINTKDNCPNTQNIDQADYDGDGAGDACDLDDDNDTLLDVDEILFYRTNTLATDTDGDGLSDPLEINTLGTSPLLTDTDSDGLADNDELTANTNPLIGDSDRDGLKDGEEVSIATDPLDTDTDNDGLNDAFEVSNGINPLSQDSDADTLLDPLEVELGTNPVATDTDGDSLSDPDELNNLGSNPISTDTDTDGYADNTDNCIITYNPSQVDYDADNIGLECDSDETFPTPSFNNVTLNDTGFIYSFSPPNVIHDSATITKVCSPTHFEQDCFNGRDADYLADTTSYTASKIGAGNSGFDFTKLASDGSALPDSATEWDCVQDNHTGLIWQAKSLGNNQAGDELHDADDQFSWYNTDNTQNGNNVGSNDTLFSNTCYNWTTVPSATRICNTQAYTSKTNIDNLCGFDDWRLPTRVELLTIFDYGIEKNGINHTTPDPAYFNFAFDPFYDSSAFDPSLATLQKWATLDTDINNRDNIWAIALNSTISSEPKSSNFYVRLVRKDD